MRTYPRLATSLRSNILMCLLAGLLVSASASAAQVKADRVLGQTTFSTNTPGSTAPVSFGETVDRSLLNGPGGVAVSPTSNKVFVADYFTRRVLRYANAATLANGAASETTLYLPLTGGAWSISVDKNDSLWIADNGSGRILRYDTASTIATFGGTPSLALTVPGCEYLFVDARGTLWVSYGLNSSTVTWLANATTLASTVPIVPVWTGTLTFTNKPELGGIAVLAKGKKATLWVADANNSKVYRFTNPKSGQSEKNAAAVLGQPTISSKGPKSGSAGLSYPRSLFIDAKGRLWVADTANDKAAKNANRVLRWDNAANLKTGAKASAVIGQSNYTNKRTGVSSKLIAPFRGGICLDLSGTVWFADDFNNRVLHFTRVPKSK